MKVQKKGARLLKDELFHSPCQKVFFQNFKSQTSWQEKIFWLSWKYSDDFWAYNCPNISNPPVPCLCKISKNLKTRHFFENFLTHKNFPLPTINFSLSVKKSSHRAWRHWLFIFVSHSDEKKRYYRESCKIEEVNRSVTLERELFLLQILAFGLKLKKKREKSEKSEKKFGEILKSFREKCLRG